MDIHLDNSLSIQEAAAYYNVSEKTIRRRIKKGSLPAFQHTTAQGFEWRVQLPNHVDHIDSSPRQTRPTLDNQLDITPRQDSDSTPLIKALDLIKHLQEENIQLAGQLGFYQAKLQEADQQIRLLTTTQKEGAPPDEKRSTRPWWRRFLSKNPTIDK